MLVNDNDIMDLLLITSIYCNITLQLVIRTPRFQ